MLDATADDLPPSLLEAGGVDLVLLQFSLSAVAPKDMMRVARLAERALRPGGKLLFRDYGRYYGMPCYTAVGFSWLCSRFR